MADRTKIEWADATWNPVRGCTRVSEGCRNCYAEVMAARFSDPGQWGQGLARRVALPGGGTDHRWTGKVGLVESALDQPLRWRKPRRIFVCSTSDLFHENVPDAWIDRVFAVMALARHHTFLVLTKRPERAWDYLSNLGVPRRVRNECLKIDSERWDNQRWHWPLPNVWLGTSVEDQATADARIPHLLDTPAAVRFISAEPLLGPVDLRNLPFGEAGPTGYRPRILDALTAGSKSQTPWHINWVIVGGESGPHARPMHPDWARALRDQCQAARVAFFFKQWGDHVGKRAAGRLLDGREWNEVPG